MVLTASLLSNMEPEEIFPCQSSEGSSSCEDHDQPPSESESHLDLPVKVGVSYFNNAGMTALPPSVAAAGRDAVSQKSCPWESLPSDLTDDVEDIRKMFSSLMNGSGDGSDVAIVPSTSFALTMAARNLERTGRVRPNSRIVLIQDQMSSAVYCWQDVCSRIEG